MVVASKHKAEAGPCDDGVMLIRYFCSRKKNCTFFLPCSIKKEEVTKKAPVLRKLAKKNVPK